MMLHNKNQGSRLCGFRKEDFFLSSLYTPKHVTPGRTFFFLPQWHYLVEVHLVMLNTNYQGSWPRGFRQEDFFTFSLYKPM